MTSARDYIYLTPGQQTELGELIANGGSVITRTCQRARIDWFRVRLSDGTQITGSYRWGSERGEFVRFRVS